MLLACSYKHSLNSLLRLLPVSGSLPGVLVQELGQTSRHCVIVYTYLRDLRPSGNTDSQIVCKLRYRVMPLSANIGAGL